MVRLMTVDRWPKILLKSVLLLILLICYSVGGSLAGDQPVKKVLIFNSYHQGYKWSDDVMSGIASVLGTSISNVELQIEYMDTQRIADAGYLQKLSEVYSYKFRGKHFDAIISSDDPAFKFLLKNRNKLFPETPIIFCGVNYFDDAMLAGQQNISGVVEAQDIASTLDLALKLHPGTKEIYVVNDNSITGQAIAKDLNKVIPRFKGRISFKYFSDLSIEQHQKNVAKLSSDSLILYLIFFEDSAGQKFSYNEGISRIAAYAKVPIYGVWDFSLGYGLTGGMLTSGFFQGETAAQLTQRILNGEEASSIPVVKLGSNRYMFDSSQLKRFKIKFSLLPPASVIINESNEKRKQVLVLNSYHYGMNWTDGIDDGISSQFSGKDNIDLYFEFMDTKRNSEPEFLQRLHQLFRYKFRSKKFDLIITSDDDAYNIARRYHTELFPQVPIVFCGVNFFQPADLANDNLITGVVEAVDIRKSIQIALKLHPETRKIFVINDLTSTGVANRKLFNTVIGDFDSVKFEFLEDVNMSELEEQVSRLSAGDLIFLLSFNRDKSNNIFSYDESIRRISAHSKVPIYGVWDFYLGHGIVGGMLTNGFSQGELAAKIGLRILNGEHPDQIPPELKSPNRYMFDYNYLKLFRIDSGKLPSQSIVINRPNLLIEKYSKSAAITLSLLSVVSAYIFYRRKKSRDFLKQMAETDPLTGIKNRRAGLAYLKQMIKSANLLKTCFTISFIDLDKLKEVNDTYGHVEGDRYLREATQILNNKIRKGDMLCRYGGDEFVAAFSNCNVEQAIDLWNKIEEDILKFNQSRVTAFNISMSRGFVEYDPFVPIAVSELVETADTEMYRFKQNRKASEVRQ